MSSHWRKTCRIGKVTLKGVFKADDIPFTHNELFRYSIPSRDYWKQWPDITGVIDKWVFSGIYVQGHSYINPVYLPIRR